MAAKKTILFYSTHKSWGGSEKYWYETLNHPLFLENFSAKVMLHTDKSTIPIGQKLASKNIELRFFSSHLSAARKLLSLLSYPLRKWTGFSRDKLFFHWFDYLNAAKPNLVWFNISGANALISNSLLYGASLCRKNNTPYWLIFQHMREDFLPSEKTIQEIEVLLNGAQRVLFVSKKNKFTLERALGFQLPNASLTKNAIQDTFIQSAQSIGTEHPPSHSGKAHFLHLGQFVPGHKGQHLLFEVLSRPKWLERDWDLTLLGGGEFQRMERLMRFFNFPQDRLIVPGFTNDVLGEIAKTDMLLMPSLSEGTPFAMVECMACGRPALGTPVAGIPELIRDGKTGWLTRSLEPDDIDQALDKAWHERHLWAVYGRNAQQMIAEEYNQEKTISEVIKWLKADCR
jgi:glycosyltransferase involved in cell wall biosynthesis